MSGPETTLREYAPPERIGVFAVLHEDDWRERDILAGSTRPWAIQVRATGSMVRGPSGRIRVFRRREAALAAAKEVADGQ